MNKTDRLFGNWNNSSGLKLLILDVNENDESFTGLLSSPVNGPNGKIMESKIFGSFKFIEDEKIMISFNVHWKRERSNGGIEHSISMYSGIVKGAMMDLVWTKFLEYKNDQENTLIGKERFLKI